MQVALISSGAFENTNPKHLPTLEEGLLACAWREAENQQIIALMHTLNGLDNFEPCLVCRQDSHLFQLAEEQNLPVLALRTGKHPLDRFRLWRWQRKIPHILILLMGGEALDIASRLRNMRNKDTTTLICSFLLKAPNLERKQARIIANSSLLICGSEAILNKVALDMEKHVRQSWPGSAIVAPGLPCENYVMARPWEEIPGRNFVFGMTQSLTRDSGALLIIRAMAAMWQKEELPPFEVRMFGSGPRFDEILEEAKTLGVISRLSILSEQNLSKLACLCDAWLAPGVAEEELPETLGAGFAAGLPVICSQSPLHMERLEGNAPRTAIRVEEDNPQKMARAMIAVMSDAKLRERLVEEGKGELERLDLSRMSREMIAILENVAFGKSRSERSESFEKRDSDNAEGKNPG